METDPVIITHIEAPEAAIEFMMGVIGCDRERAEEVVQMVVMLCMES